jgi:hypothetical protein
MVDVRIERCYVVVGLAVLAACSGTPTTPGGSGGGTVTSLTAAGQSAVFLDSAFFNTTLDLAAGGEYLIAVVNTSTTASVAADFTLTGSYSSQSASRVAPRPAAPHVPSIELGRFELSPTPAGRYDVGRAPERLAALRRLQGNHLRMLERSAKVLQRYGAARGAGAKPRFNISQTVGAVNKIYIAKEFGASCADVDSIGARTVAVGQHVVVLADTTTTASYNGKPYWQLSDSLRPDSSFYQTFANEYDALTYQHILTYIGNPLQLDNQLSNVGKVTVVISPVLNNFGGGIVAFVDGCDFNDFAATGSQQSLDNQTEMFYYWTPDTSLGWNVQAWEELMRATAAHETKHIVSFTDRIINNGFSVPELIWLEEGLAQESSEIWERNFNKATWKGHANFAQTVECESIFSGGTPCDPSDAKPIALMGSHLPFLFDYLQEESGSPAGHGLGTDTPANYGAGWEFARWATDIYGSSEPNFIQQLVNEPSLNGLPNLAKHTGATVPTLLVYWSLATAFFDTTSYTAADVRTTIPSFNFQNIFWTAQDSIVCLNGAQRVPCSLFTNGYSPALPVTPAAFTAGSTPVDALVPSLPGTAAYYVVLNAPNSGSEKLELKTGSGGALSSGSRSPHRPRRAPRRAMAAPRWRNRCSRTP